MTMDKIGRAYHRGDKPCLLFRSSFPKFISEGEIEILPFHHRLENIQYIAPDSSIPHITKDSRDIITIGDLIEHNLDQYKDRSSINEDLQVAIFRVRYCSGTDLSQLSIIKRFNPDRFLKTRDDWFKITRLST